VGESAVKAWMIVVLLVIIGIIGAWVGYWIGHALGWSANAEFPLKIGGGTWAIGLSILLSFGSVMAGIGWFVARPLRRVRQLLATGTPGHATVRRFWRTGFRMRSGSDVARRQLGFELDVHADGGRDYAATATGLLTDAEEAALKPGAEVTIRFDPGRPTSVAVVGPLAT
jgi:hypothetical protein